MNQSSLMLRKHQTTTSINFFKVIHKKLLILPNSVKSKSFPSITSQSWSILDAKTGQLLWGFNEKCELEIASLTKIMTLYTAITIASKAKIDLIETQTQISKEASEVTGTTANLPAEYSIKLIDLFYAMMLPSGNDAAYCIAEYFGNVLIEQGMKPCVEILSGNVKSISSIDVFVYQMNRNAFRLGLKNTKFTNPHGLSDKNNHSNAKEIGIFSCAAKKNKLFSEIVNCREYKCEIYNEISEKKCMKWTNTNFLLQSGFDGIKTGITPTAGPCLVASCKAFGMNDIIIVMLNSRSMETRWNEAILLKNWIGRNIVKLVHTLKTKLNATHLKKLPPIHKKAKFKV